MQTPLNPSAMCLHVTDCSDVIGAVPSSLGVTSRKRRKHWTELTAVLLDCQSATFRVASSTKAPVQTGTPEEYSSVVSLYVHTDKQNLRDLEKLLQDAGRVRDRRTYGSVEIE